MRRRIVEIVWIDAKTMGGWSDAARYEQSGTALCRSVGYVVSRNAERTVLIQSASDTSGNISDSIAIPARCIKRVRRLG